MAKAKTFGQRIRELRLAKNLTQRELADGVAARLRKEAGRGFDVTYLSKIENDQLPPPSTPAILGLASGLDANSDELLALAGKAPPDVGETLKKSPAARAFFRSATDAQLTEQQWQDMLDKLKRGPKQ